MRNELKIVELSERVREVKRDGKRMMVIEEYENGDVFLVIYDDRIRVRLVDGSVIS